MSSSIPTRACCNTFFRYSAANFVSLVVFSSLLMFSIFSYIIFSSDHVYIIFKIASFIPTKRGGQKLVDEECYLYEKHRQGTGEASNSGVVLVIIE